MSSTGGGIVVLRHTVAQSIRGNTGWQIQNDSDYDVAVTSSDLDSWFANVNPTSSFTKLIPGF